MQKKGAPDSSPATDHVLQVRNLTKQYPIRGGLLRRRVGVVTAVSDLSFDVQRGETLALVGGAGSGKSTLARTLLHLTGPTGGQIVFENQDVTQLRGSAVRRLRRQMQLLLSDPYTSLNPRLRVSDIIGEPLEIHGVGSRAERKQRVTRLMQQTALNPHLAQRYPHECSGVQRQRASLARALATEPAMLIVDEPAAALDRSVQGQIVALLRRVKQAAGLTVLLLTADFRLAAALGDRIGVLYAGQLVELADAQELAGRPLHPYTRQLLDAPGPGTVQNTAQPPPACRFHPRCPLATAVCRQQGPEWRNLGTAEQPHWVACHHAEKANE